MGPGQIIKTQINLDLIEIILFCLKINDLLRPPTYVWVYWWLGGWVVGWIGGWVDGWVHMSVNGWGKVI